MGIPEWDLQDRREAKWDRRDRRDLRDCRAYRRLARIDSGPTTRGVHWNRRDRHVESLGITGYTGY